MRSRCDAVRAHQSGHVCGDCGKPRSCYHLTRSLLCRQFEIERQQEGKRIGAVFHAVGFADGGIEGGDGGFKRVIAGIFDRAVKRAQGQAMFGAQGAAQAA